GPRLLRPGTSVVRLPGGGAARRRPQRRRLRRRRRDGGLGVTARTVVLWRHGRTSYNEQRRLQGQVDIPLDEVGRWQAAQAAHDIAERHSPTRIVSSDLERAAGTAQALAELVGVE